MADREHPERKNPERQPEEKENSLPDGFDDEELRARFGTELDEENRSEKKHQPHARRAPRSVRKDRRLVFHLVDAVILLLIVAAVITLTVGYDSLRGLFTSETSPRDANMVYTVVFSHVDAAFADAVKAGDSVTLGGEDSVAFGTVSAVTKAPTKTLLPNPDATEGETAVGTLTDAEDGTYEVTVTVRTAATYRVGKGYTVQGVRLAIGGIYNLRFPGWTASGLCVGLTALTEGGE